MEGFEGEGECIVLGGWCVWVLIRVCCMAVYACWVLLVEVEGDWCGFPHYFGECRLEGVLYYLVVEERQSFLVGDEIYV